jgi:prepilin-type N-terminal cleavage/methylation domain-containing protein
MTAPRTASRRAGGFTLIEVLISVLLLSVCLMAMMQLWSISRKITERSRDTAEYYAVSRQEIERYRAIGFNNIFNQGLNSASPSYLYYNLSSQTSVAPVHYYAANGAILGSSAGAYYAVTSTFSVAATDAESGTKRLGVQKVAVYLATDTGFTNPLFSTTIYFTAAGV